MASAATSSRRDVKAQWLLAHPSQHEWLRQRVPSRVSAWRKDPQAGDMVSALKAAGIYAPKTVAIDICAAMRRLAVSTTRDMSASDRAVTEIEIILSRDGLDRKTILEKLMK